MDTSFFRTDVTDLPEATRPQVLELADGDQLQLRPGPVAKRLGDSTVRMLGYNGSIPGPTLEVRQGSEVVVHARNDTDLDTTVHWHGLRLENRADGVPQDTQAPIPLENRTPHRAYRLAVITVTGEIAEPPLRDAFERLRTAPELSAERRQLDTWLAAPPDKTLAIVAEMDDRGAATVASPGSYACPMHPEVVSDSPGRCPECGMKLMATTPTTEPGNDAGTASAHAHHHVSATADGIEWEDEMAETNRATTAETMRWKLLDRSAGRDGLPVDWRFTEGQRVKIRLVNEKDSDHPMHHPFHIHGAGRFLVLARDRVPEPNLVWKDTVLIPTGQTVDIVLDVTNPGRWMAHCHIAEHMHAGRMFSFTVDRAATS